MPLVKSTKKNSKKSKKSAAKSPRSRSKKSPKSTQTKKQSTKKLPPLPKKEITEKKTEKKLTPSELLAQRRKERQSAEDKIKADKEAIEKKKADAKKAEEKEIKKMEKTVKKYVINLEKEMEKKNMTEYFILLDNNKHKIFHNGSIDDMEEVVKQNPKKFDKKNLVQVLWSFTHDIRNTDDGAGFIDRDNWIIIYITLYEIRKGESFRSSITYSCSLAWHTLDFKVTKFTDELLDFVIKQLSNGKISCFAIGGVPIRDLVGRFERAGVPIPKKILDPLV